jgi:hypothetical protein
MSNLTLSVDEQAAEKARAAAKKMGMSLNQFLRAQIERLAGYDQRKADHEAYEVRCRKHGGRLNGWKFDRDQANRRG